jgi:antitoxin (DNA-binding transcriptional repressor) of toxin-antitoxin stability system
VLTTNDKGNIAEAAIALEAIKLGIDVLKPVAEHGRYDLAFDFGERIVRVQCKWARLEGAVVCVNLVGYRLTSGGSVRSKYTADEIDAVAAYCQALDRVFLLPASEVAGRSAVYLRIGPTKNGQRAAINWADNYSLGAIAQLGERVSGTHEVAGSSPAGSTPRADRDGNEVTVGAHQFRNHSGYWMERAAAGDEILITRRGRRYARLGLPDPQLATTDTAPAPEPAADPAAPDPGTARTSR